ncbi:S1 family peptidase [Massilia sp. B-10]|nr:S1 family peptidase [Massilia sp. B-10]
MKHPLPALSAGLGAACLLAALPLAAAPDRARSSRQQGKHRGPDHGRALLDRRTLQGGQALAFAHPPSGRGARRSEGRHPARPGREPGRQPPSARPKIAPKQLYAPDQDQNSLSEIEPQATGTFGTPFTSTRVFPLFGGVSAPLSADRAYPYVTVGKLFFSIGGSPFVCSASVIQRRVVVTAGHCVHSGTGAASTATGSSSPRSGMAWRRSSNGSGAT